MQVADTAASAVAEGRQPSLEAIGESPPAPGPDDTEEQKPVVKPPRHLEPDKKLTARVEAQRKALNAAGTTPAEQVLLDLVCGELALFTILEDAQTQLALRVLQLVESPRLCLTLAKALREVGLVNTAVSRRIREALQAAASLRAQRRFLRDAGGLDDDQGHA